MIHHVETRVASLNQHRPFWDWLLLELGWQRYNAWASGQSWQDSSGIYLVLSEGEPGIADHLALTADSSEAVDDLWEQIETHGGMRLYDGEYPYAGGPEHYAAYFCDPGGIKFEIVAPANRANESSRSMK